MNAGPPRRSDMVFLAEQFGVNLLVTIAMTMLMSTLIFHGRVAVPLWGMGNLAFDLIPSTVLPCIAATLAISKVTGSAVRQGLIQPTGGRAYTLLPRSDALAGLVLGCCLLAVLGSGFIAWVAYVYGRQPVPYPAMITTKLIYALILCLANTPVIIARAKARSAGATDDNLTA